MKKAKILSLLMAAALGLSALTGCGGGSAQQQGSAGTQASDSAGGAAPELTLIIASNSTDPTHMYSNGLDKFKEVAEEVSGGGVTLSGGEPLAQNMDYIEGLCKRLKRRGYHINIDTCGHVPYEHFARVLPYVDTFLYDLKHMDPEKHTALTGISNERILDNLRRLSADGASINIRMPLISGLNDSDEEIAAVLDFLSTIHVASINLLPYHKTGSDKYARLGEEAYTNMQAPSQERMEYLRSLFESKGFISVKIGG